MDQLVIAAITCEFVILVLLYHRLHCHERWHIGMMKRIHALEEAVSASATVDTLTKMSPEEFWPELGEK